MHPVQESAGMEPETIKRDYGDKIVVYGSLDMIDGLFAYDGDELERVHHVAVSASMRRAAASSSTPATSFSPTSRRSDCCSPIRSSIGWHGSTVISSQ